MTEKKNENKGCLFPIILLIIGFVCIWIGVEYDIPVIKTLGFGFPGYASCMYTESVSGKKYTWKRHAMYISIILLACIAITFIFYRKLW